MKTTFNKSDKTSKDFKDTENLTANDFEKYRLELTQQYLSAEIQLTPEQEQFVATKLGSKLWRLDSLYTIRDKNGTKMIMHLNDAQRKVATQYRHKRKIILKSRQQGISTFMLAYYLDNCLFKAGYQAGIQSYGIDEADKLSKRAELMWNELDQNIKDILNIKIVSNNSKGVTFSNGSVLKIGNFRGDTLQGLHVSELAKIAKKYPDKAKELKTGAFQAVGKDNTLVIESTAEGKAGLFYEMWVKAYAKAVAGIKLGKLDFQAIFLSWLEDPDCQLEDEVEIPQDLADYFGAIENKLDIVITPQQKWWYVSKQDELGADMKQEYPTTPDEAFEQSLEGTIFKKEYEKLYAEHRVDTNLHRPNLPVYVSYDIGVNDITVLTFVQVVEKRPRVIHSYANSGEGLDHYVNVMWSLVREQGYNIVEVFLPHDANVRDFSTGRTRLERFMEQGVPATLLKRQSVLDGIEATRQFLKVVVIEKECDMLLLAIQQYRWKFDKTANVMLPIPLHDWTSNYLDSLKYMAQGLSYDTTAVDTAYDLPDDDTYYGDDEYSGL